MVRCKILDSEKGTKQFRTPGGNQNLTIVSESAMYTLVLRSDKPIAIEFHRWITTEVLPSIRKTGSYSAPQKVEMELSLSERLAALEVTRAALANTVLDVVAKYGFTGNQAILTAAKWLKNSGIDLTTPLLADSRHLNPTEIGAEIGLTSRQTNKALEERGFQVQASSGGWIPTAKGQKHSVLLDCGKKHSNGTPVQQLKWKDTIIKELT